MNNPVKLTGLYNGKDFIVFMVQKRYNCDKEERNI